MSNYKVTLWGTRGSLVQTSIDKMKYGLETSCISVETEKEIFLIDCGSGASGFDKYIYENNITNKKINILITHYHQDHIMGMGFLNFIYDKNVSKEIFGLGNVYETLKNYYGSPYFPITIVDLPNIKTTSLDSFPRLKFEDLEVHTTLLNHPQDCVGYKFVGAEKTLAILFDYEYKTDPNKASIEEFIKESDYLVIDSFSTEEDYKEGWGHNSIEDSIFLATKTNVATCLLTHHNMHYDDNKLDEIQDNISKIHNNIYIAKDNSSFTI